MSATNRGAERQRDDSYATPPAVVDAILPHLPLSGGILEPGCGKGNIIERLIAAGVSAKRITGIEIDSERAAVCRSRFDGTVTVLEQDFLDYRVSGFGLVIGNPPFSLALEFAKACLDCTFARRGTTALLVRLNWIAPAKRSGFLEKNRPDVYVLEQRPSFVASLKCGAGSSCGWRLMQELDEERPKICPKCGDSVDCSTSDATEYAWLIWGPGRGGRWQSLPAPREGSA